MVKLIRCGSSSLVANDVLRTWPVQNHAVTTIVDDRTWLVDFFDPLEPLICPSNTMISVTHLCLNGHVLSVVDGKCKIFDKGDRWDQTILIFNNLIRLILRKCLALTVPPNESFDFDIQRSIGEFNVRP
jgi:hypothetical protein